MKQTEKDKNIEVEECNCNEGEECCCCDNCECNGTDNENCDCVGKNIDHQDDKKNKKDKKDKGKDKIAELQKNIEQLKEQSLRSQAELINYRKRKDEEISKMLKYANEDMIRELLPIIDNFERAIKMDDDNLEDDVSKFLSGFKMIYCKLVAILEKVGVKAIDGANKPFDPTYHQAVMMETREGLEAGMVIEVLQKGYLYKDKVIRPAMVKVSE